MLRGRVWESVLRMRLAEHSSENEIGGTLCERDWWNTVLRERLGNTVLRMRLSENVDKEIGGTLC